MLPDHVAAVRHHWWLFLLRGVAGVAFGGSRWSWASCSSSSRSGSGRSSSGRGSLSRLRYNPLLVALSTLVAVVVVCSRPAGAQVPPAHLDERVRSTADTSQTFALYLPPGYTTERRWPVLFALDPRGRALLGAKRFQCGAARLALVVPRSLNTLSAGPPAAHLAGAK